MLADERLPEAMGAARCWPAAIATEDRRAVRWSRRGRASGSRLGAAIAPARVLLDQTTVSPWSWRLAADGEQARP